jgi:F-type H+-transporting ATPase subunit a
MMIAEIILASVNPLEHVVAHDLFKIGPVSVNNHMLMVTVAGVLMLILFPVFVRRHEMVPRGVQNFFESICVYIRDEVARPMLKEKTDNYICLIWTVFFFILFCNLLGMVPTNALVNLLSGGRYPDWGGTATGDIYVTGALAGVMFFVIHGAGILTKVRHHREKRSPLMAWLLGTWDYFAHIAPHIEGPIGVILFVPLMFLESMSVLIKCVALAIRLFANMIAGHLLVGVLLLFVAMGKTLLSGLALAGVSVLGCVAVSALDLFIAFLQAYIFAFLSAIFISMAVYQEH